MVGVAEDDVRAGVADHLRGESLHGGLRADGHERGRGRVAVRRVQGARAGGPVGGVEGEGEGHLQQ